MNAVNISVMHSGPIFDGRAQMIAERSCRDMEHHLGSVGADFVRAELERVLRKETPYYRLQVTSTEYPGHTVINDGGVVYGPWLEGTGSRNRTTRFKGYSTFRRVARKLDAESTAILRPYTDRMVAEINYGA